jgi:hypothetical protein
LESRGGVPFGESDLGASNTEENISPYKSYPDRITG